MVEGIGKDGDMGGNNKAKARYDADHTKQIKLKLNLKTDADIIERLNSVGHKQTYIKALIRADIAKDAK